MLRGLSKWLCCTCLIAAGCARDADPDQVHVRFRTSLPLSAADVRFAPADAVHSARLGSSGDLVIERRSAGTPVTLEVPGFCPLRIAKGPQAAALQLTPLIDLGGDRSPLGFDARFAVAVQHGCPELGRGRIVWTQLSGPPLRELSSSEEGFRLSARTASLAELHPEPLPAGIVPFSPRTQGRVVLEACWQRDTEPALVRTLSLAATSRASGLSSVAVSQQLVLSGAPYRVKSAPQGGHATALANGPVSLFTPDAPGRWVLEREAGDTLSLQALWHDKTPYDCGRSECHAQIASTTESSPMSHALERQLPASAAVGCLLDCHVTGERGLADGGFLAVAAELGFSWLPSTRWEDLPRALRRLGGVRCTACHGPGAIPPPETRAAILQSDICATCHDAPPRYPQVSAWRASRMARSDAEPSTRVGECAECHTTSGFLGALGARTTHAASLTDAPAGIACAACHAPHATHRGQRLLRSDAGGSAEAAANGLCLRCHTPKRDALQPTAAAGPLLLGLARVPAANGLSWEDVRGPAAHASVRGGCIGCHGAQPSAAGKLDHAFRVDMAVCAGCHADDSPSRMRDAQAELRERAQRVMRALAPQCETLAPWARSQPLHANPSARCSTQPQARARYEASLVLEDPAAGVHNPAFARALLRDAEQQLAAPAP